jgi:hypothetical protein
MSIGDWLVVALACGAGIVGPLLAASGGESTITVLVLGLFAGVVIDASPLLKRQFDCREPTGH